MKRSELEEPVKRYIENRLERSSDAPENILSSASEVASELLGTVALSTAPSGEGSRVYRIKFVRTGRHTSMLVLITSTGMVKSRLFRCDFDITPEMLNVFDRALTEKLAGRPLQSVNRAFAQTFAASFGELGLLMPDMLIAVLDACEEAGTAKVYTSGATKLLYQNELDLISARAVLEFMNDDSKRRELLSTVPDGTEILIGNENSSPHLRKCSEVVTSYSIDNKPAGSIAVIGSMRLDYSRAVSVLEYIAKVSGELIDEIISAQS
jgi:heat-inducible transcriptional repressor